MAQPKTNVRFAGPAVILAAILAGCGSSAQTTTVNPAPVVRARAAARLQHIQDRYLKGPRRLAVKCDGATCTVTLFVRPQAFVTQPGEPMTVPIDSETWEDGELVDGNIAGFLRSDDHFDCSGGESTNC